MRTRRSDAALITAVGVAATIWLVVLVKLPALRHVRTNTAVEYFWGSLVLLALCITADRAYGPIGRIAGIPNVAFPAIYGSGMVAAYWCQRFLRAAQDGKVRPAPWRRAMLAVALVVMVGCYLAGPVHEPNDYWITHPIDPDWPTLGMYLTIATYTGATLAEIGWRCWSLSRLTGDRALRWGLRLAAGGAALVLFRMLLEYVVYAAAAALVPGPAVAASHGAVSESRTVSTIGVGLMAVGVSLPAGARLATRVRAWLVGYAALRRLRWLRGRLDDVATSLPRLGVGRVGPLNVDAELYRVVIELCDARLALRRFVCRADDDPYTNGGSTGPEADARAYQFALLRRRAGLAPRACRGNAPAPRTYQEEIAYLGRVARAWRRPPVSVTDPVRLPTCASCQVLPGSASAR